MTAVAGGYLVTSLLTACLARLLPLSAVEATTAATLASFPVGALVVMWVFAARSIGRVWLLLAVAAILLAGATWLSIGASGRA